MLCDVEQLSYEEIAATLNVKLGTVRSRISRGRAMLRGALADRAPDVPAASVTPGVRRIHGDYAETAGAALGDCSARLRPGCRECIERPAHRACR